jgi:hypothetical protein
VSQRESDASRLSAGERELSDLEKIGVLHWSDSEGSDGADEMRKKESLNFLKQMNTLYNAPEQSVQQPVAE